MRVSVLVDIAGLLALVVVLPERAEGDPLGKVDDRYVLASAGEIALEELLEARAIRHNGIRFV